MRSENPDVLVVGGSTVGLCTALFLSRAGIRTLVVERRQAPPEHPRAMGIGPRTVEILRAAGIADAVDAQCVDMTGDDLQMFATPTLAEADLDALSRQAPPRGDAFGRLTPQTLRGTCPQGRLDQVVADEARAAGARVEFGTELLDFVQDDDGVTARVAGPDGVREIRARYLVAADGARSGVRERLSIATSGPGTLGDPLISVLFRADLTELTHGHTFVVCDITTPKAPGGLLPVDGRTEWIYHFRYAPESGQKAEDFTPQKCAERIREAIGPAADVRPDVVSILPWQVRGLVADRFRCGRVFLAGDAAHVIPPVGAFGMNTGVADAHNLAWKLAHVLDGTAGEALLDTYEAERLPVARTALEQSMLRLEDPSLHWASGQEGRERRAGAGALNAPVVHLGYRYDSAAVLDAHPELPSGEDVERDLDGSPGSRLPHHWLPRGHGRVSTLDLIDHRFTLLTGARGQEWLDALGKAAARIGVPVDGHRVEDGEGAADGTGTPWTTQVGIEDSGALLVRPDGFVAWRARSVDDAPALRLGQALAALVARPAQPS
ncbi:FAD-dependent monooxygenase [Streptomyces sp. NPDC088360]|uniref:FAD-dependent monooxygenase n=1 Tax=Streptomyces sp. NPDC088360 TaxID=3154515 RepID=UPI00344C4F05